MTNAYPDGWYVRIMFDELLDPSIETLSPVLDENGDETDTFTGSIAAANPVTLRCESVNGGMVTVDYDGYYSPAGNRITWPLGPSLVIKPADPTLIATNSQCEITLNESIKDKSGTAVDSAQRGPYTFQVAPVEVIAISPANDPDGEAPIDAARLFAAASPTTTTTTGFYVHFNTTVDPASFCDEGANMNECAFKIEGATQGTCSSDPAEVCEVSMNGADCAIANSACRDSKVTALAPLGLTDSEFAFTLTRPAKVETEYTFSFKQGATIKDRCGKATTLSAGSADSLTLATVKTNPFKLNTTSIATGETASPLKKPQAVFSNTVDLTTLDASEYTITPVPNTPSLGVTNNAVSFFGHYNINTEYTLTINAGATVADANGVVFTNAMAKTVTWKTQPAVTATFTADNSTFTRVDATTRNGVTITFNTSLPTTDLTDPETRTTTELTEGTEFTVTGPNNAAVTGWTIDTTSNTGCLPTGTSCAIRIRKALAAGDYKFTLKAGAAVTDVLGNTYTQMADRVINFTVEDADTTPAPDCL